MDSFSRLPIALILVFSLGMNLWGNGWGAPDYWHPDELTRTAIRMVDERTLNPGSFFYGGLHYSILAAGAVLPARIYGKLFDPKPKETDKRISARWEERLRIRTIRLARSISAVMATLQVLLTSLIGGLLFGKTVGVLAALFLCVSPYFVTIGHFATVDTSANFWYWLSCFLALLSWKKESNLWLSLACVTAGLAIGEKIDRVVIILPLLYSYRKRTEREEFWKLLKFGPLVLAGYVLANPALLLSTFLFLDGTTRDLFFNIARGDTVATSPFLWVLRDIKSGMGLLLLLAVLGGFGLAARNFLLNKNRDEIGWLVMSFVPYYLLIGSRFSLPWYAPFFFPALTIFAAYGCHGMQEIAFPFIRQVAKAIPVVIFFSSLASSLSLNLQIVKDSRYLASEWIDQQIPAGASIDVGERGPAISNNKYRLTRLTTARAYDDWNLVRNWRDQLDRRKSYHAIRKWILELEQFKARISGLPAREKPYRAWFDHAVESADAAKKKDAAELTPDVAKADYVVLIEYLDFARISAMMAPDSGYRVIKKFQYRDPFGIQLKFSFVNPVVYVFSRS